MIDINSFLLVTVCFLSSILLVVLIVLSIKLIGTVNRVNDIMDEVETQIKKADRMFSIVDTVTDGMALVSDKIVDGITYLLRKVFKSQKRKEEKIYEEE